MRKAYKMQRLAEAEMYVSGHLFELRGRKNGLCGLPLDADPLDSASVNAVCRPVIKLRRARAFVLRNDLRPFNQIAIEQIRRNAGCAEGGAICLTAEAGDGAAALDHAENIGAAEPAVAEAAFLRHRAPERLLRRPAERI